MLDTYFFHFVVVFQKTIVSFVIVEAIYLADIIIN